MLKNAPLSLLIIVFVLCSVGNLLFAQSHAAWSFGGSLRGGAGVSSYTDHPDLTNSRDFGMVWHCGIDFSTWYQLTPRLSVVGGCSIRIQYFQLQTYSTIPELANRLSFALSDEEKDYYLDRVRSHSYMGTLNFHTEYLARPHNQTPINLGLYAGASLGLAPVSRVRTLYGERDLSGKNFLPRLGSAHLFEGISAQGPIEGYFEDKLNKTLLFFQVGLVYYFYNKSNQQSIRATIVYEGTTAALSQGFNSPLKGISLNIGVRLN